MKITSQNKLLLPVFCSAFLLSGCWLDSDDDKAVEPVELATSANVRVVHASPDAPTVDIIIGGTPISQKLDLDYQDATAWYAIAPNTYEISVEANLPGDDANVLTFSPALVGSQTYTILAIGSVGQGTLEALVVENTLTPVTAGNVRAQIVHAAPNAPEVDVYVTAPDTLLSAEQPLATLAYKGFTGQVEVPAGDYQIRITPAGSTTVVFDSGTLALAAGSDLLISATQNVVTGSSPVSLVVATGAGSATILDKDTPAEIRAVHAVADAPAVDIIANNALTLFDGAPFKGATSYIEVAAGDYLIDVAADADNSIVVIDDAAITLTAGMRYTAIANNTLALIDLDLIIDTPRKIATAAQVRIFHASQATPNVDIYVTADGEITDVSPAFSDVPYATGALAETGYVQLPAGDYVVTVTPTGTKTEAIETGVLSLAAGEIYTAFAVDGDMEGAAPQLILLDGFVVPQAN
ncbi:DUF4397 domain-containing protein [Brumicola pallidula]|uniref:DUF4397 domain-containing protein n=1 Tax=Brumicola pallidula DSM 14239 = ACAM 615 TaxID=1121922 RepID=K6ZKI0_9ALTE|nr:DUF4397 domain-containing protein [Glaciecola pallidula]GAC29398.1 hypothetical protein GPAL_2541 [Glaciecola pallidula DSM 14239 = ACAM 615]